MPVKHIPSVRSNEFTNTVTYMERPRLHNLLEDAMNYQLVSVYAGAGYGKSRAVESFLQQYDAFTTWLQVSERDNVSGRFWENFVHMIALTWPEASVRFSEIGFPDTEVAFTRFQAILREAVDIPGKHVMVYDDFHLLHNQAVLQFLDRAFRILPPNATVILISRTMPEINMAGMMMYERIFTIREETLCFTEDEISKYFNNLGLSIVRRDIRDIIDDTRGWAFAINLLGKSLGKDAKYERYALETMKLNIYKLIEMEIKRNISEKLWVFLLRISLLDNHAASLIRSLTCDESLVNGLELLNSYIRYDHYLGAYMIHSIFLEYLRQYQGDLSEDEITDTYNTAGIWCEKNDYQNDAVTYYEKSGNWDAILRIVYTYKYQTSPELANQSIDILNRIPKNAASSNPLFPIIMLKLKVSTGQLKEASALLAEYIREYESKPESAENNFSLSELYGAGALINTIMCPYTDEYNIEEYCRKKREYYDKNPYPPIGPSTNLSIGSYALLVGSSRAGAPEEYIEELSRAIPHISHTGNYCIYGIDDLARGELYFFQRELNSAEQYLKQALNKARAKDQYDIQNRSLLYLMLIAISRGDMKNVNSILSQQEALLEEKDYQTRYESYDIVLSHYHLVLGQPDKIAEWLKGDFAPFAHPAFLDNYANQVKAHYRYATRQYSELLAFLSFVREDQTLLICKIMNLILEALSLYQLKRKDEALSVFEEAYEYAYPNKIVIPFTQHGKDMRTLTAAALKDSKRNIPKAWLENINRKASAFATRKSHIISENRVGSVGSDMIVLTKRESEILKDLSQGLSRTEIAASQNISVNTVKMNINIIYEKLHANNLVNAVRIATDRKMI